MTTQAGTPHGPVRRRGLRRWAAALLLPVLLGAGCSFKRTAINMLGDALAGGGSVFSSDNDPELVEAAVPFSLKLMESLLAESPEHDGLLFATASGFTQFAFAFVQLEADEREAEDYQQAVAMRDRARRLYLRARDYGLRGLDTRHKRFSEALKADPLHAVQRLRRKDVPLAYWTAASWGAAIALAKDDPFLVAQLPQVEALIDRALELDEAFDQGAIHSFLINYEMARAGIAGDPAERARRHFHRAVELSGGTLAGPYLSYAEAVCVQQQDLAQFDALLAQALAINPDDHPESRLVNLILQRRARWLQSQREDLFLIPEPEETH